MGFGKFSNRPAGLSTFADGAGQRHWIYKPQQAEAVHVATLDYNKQELLLTCNGYQNTVTTKKCIRSVFEDILMSDTPVLASTRRGELYINGIKVEYNKPIDVKTLFNTSRLGVAHE